MYLPEVYNSEEDCIQPVALDRDVATNATNVTPSVDEWVNSSSDEYDHDHTINSCNGGNGNADSIEMSSGDRRRKSGRAAPLSVLYKPHSYRWFTNPVVRRLLIVPEKKDGPRKGIKSNMIFLRDRFPALQHIQFADILINTTFSRFISTPLFLSLVSGPEYSCYKFDLSMIGKWVPPYFFAYLKTITHLRLTSSFDEDDKLAVMLRLGRLEDHINLPRLSYLDLSESRVFSHIFLSAIEKFQNLKTFACKVQFKIHDSADRVTFEQSIHTLPRLPQHISRCKIHFECVKEVPAQGASTHIVGSAPFYLPQVTAVDIESPLGASLLGQLLELPSIQRYSLLLERIPDFALPVYGRIPVITPSNLSLRTLTYLGLTLKSAQFLNCLDAVLAMDGLRKVALHVLSMLSIPASIVEHYLSRVAEKTEADFGISDQILMEIMSGLFGSQIDGKPTAGDVNLLAQLVKCPTAILEAFQQGQVVDTFLVAVAFYEGLLDTFCRIATLEYLFFRVSDSFYASPALQRLILGRNKSIKQILVECDPGRLYLKREPDVSDSKKMLFMLPRRKMSADSHINRFHQFESPVDLRDFDIERVQFKGWY